MLRGTWYYNKEIKVENGVESAKIVTNVQTVPFISGMFVIVHQRSFVTILALSNNILHFYFHIILHTFFCESIHPRINVNKNSHAHMFAYHPQIISHRCNV